MDFDSLICNSFAKVEDEIHFITECQLHVETRNRFFNEVRISSNKCTKTMFLNLLMH